MISEQCASILDQILDPAAKDRLQRLGLLKKEKARRIKDTLISAATSGQLKTRVSDLIGLLNMKKLKKYEKST
jgi:programmed cell death protein 5